MVQKTSICLETLDALVEAEGLRRVSAQLLPPAIHRVAELSQSGRELWAYVVSGDQVHSSAGTLHFGGELDLAVMDLLLRDR